MTDLAKCPVRGCPVRYAAGPDRRCRDHGDSDQADDLAARAEAFGARVGPAADGRTPARNATARHAR